MSHRRKKKVEIQVPLGLRKIKTHQLKSRLGKFEVDEFRDFYIVKRKLSKQAQKEGKLFDPTAIVVAKRDKTLPFFPDKEFAQTFGYASPYFLSFVGTKGEHGIYDQLRIFRKGGDVLIPARRRLKELIPHDIELGSTKLANRLEELLSTKKKKR